MEPGSPEAGEALARLEELVSTLRARCPWDMRQTHLSLAPHLMEEAYEALDAIEDLGPAPASAAPELVAHLREELGDVLFQVFFHSVLAEEEGWFTLAEVAGGTYDKLVRRHPHVFGDAVADTPEEVAARWEVLKSSEKGRRGVTGAIPAGMPALALTAKLLRRAQSLDVVMPSAAELHARMFAGSRTPRPSDGVRARAPRRGRRRDGPRVGGGEGQGRRGTAPVRGGPGAQERSRSRDGAASRGQDTSSHPRDRGVRARRPLSVYASATLLVPASHWHGPRGPS